jgi:hypothetical protein
MTMTPAQQPRVAESLLLVGVRLDGGTQSRAAIDQDTVDEYAEALWAQAVLPPVLVVFDDAEYWAF